jgi:archaemetzincin
VKFTLLKETALPAFAFYHPRQRYISDSLLLFLKKYNDGRFDKVIAITAQDISTRKNGYVNYGIMGQGYCPGQCCVVSTFRPKRNVGRKQFIRRMITLALHELGHTFSLPHCEDESCFMVDAEGKMKLDNTGSYCDDCRSTLESKGVLRTRAK